MANHYNLNILKRQYDKATQTAVGVILVGDSRSTHADNRVPGQVRRCFAVKHAALVQTPTASFVGVADGCGELSPNLGAQDVSLYQQLPGNNTNAAFAVVNRWPNSINHLVCGASAPTNLWIQRASTMHMSSAGFDMRLNASTASGGSFKLGDPAQGRAVSGVKLFILKDDTTEHLDPALQYGFNGTIAGGDRTTTNTPTSGSAGGVIQVREHTGPNTGGVDFRIGMNFGVNGSSFANRTLSWFGARVDYTGGKGIILASVSQGGWNTRSHLGTTVYTEDDNPYTDFTDANGAKYSNTQAVEWLQKIIGTTTYILRVEIGANIAAGSGFAETGGEDDIGVYRDNLSEVLVRWIQILSDAGATDVVIELVGIWQTANSADTRSPALNAVLRAVAEEMDNEYAGVRVCFYDQLGAFQEAGLCTGVAVDSAAWTSDGVHQNFNGMVKFGDVEWAAIQRASPSMRARDRMGGRRGLGP